MNVDPADLAPQQPTDSPAKVPAHQHVYERVRKLILFGDFAPGQAVTIQGLAETLDAGMTPIREALRRLIAEGALVHQGNRRVSVPVLDLEGIQELEFMRKKLEPELAKRAAARMSETVLNDLIRVDDLLNSAINRGDIGDYLTQNYRFHTIINTCANAPILAATVDRLWLMFGPSLRVVCGRFGTSNLPDKHADLLAAFSEGDAERAGLAMTEDVLQGMLQIQASL
ncbi:GntR family transcriptional regulator [Sulfitobacter sp. M13]